MSVEEDESRPEPRRLMYHYTDRAGYNSIRAGVDWRFRAHSPPPRDEEHPRAAYFTTWGPDTPNLERLRLPARKRQFVFAFEDANDLEELRGGRGSFIFFYRGDYTVERARQRDSGERSEVAERLSRDPEKES